MFNKHKNTELLRHHLSRCIEKNTKDIVAAHKSSSWQISTVIFSTVVPGIATILLDSKKFTTIESRIVLYMILSICFLFFLLLTRIIVLTIQKWFKSYMHVYNSKKKSEYFIDRFDDPGCDSALIAQEYMEKYKTITNRNTKDFCLLEIIHYYSKSIDITLDLMKHCDCCIITRKQSRGVNIERVIALVEILKEIQKFILGQEVSITANNSALKEHRQFFIKNRTGDLIDIERRIKEFVDNNYPIIV